MRNKLNWRNILPILMILLAIAARLIPGARTIDDSFITFRYARNILEGHGFVYNPGAQVLGTTTPLYTFCMVLLGAVSGGAQAPFPQLALGLNALADVFTCLLLWQIGKRLANERVGLAAGFTWALAPHSVTFAIGGLETSLYVLLLTAAATFYMLEKRAGAALCASLAFTTRPDALILIGPFVIDRLVRAFHPRLKEKLGWQEVLALVLPTALWSGFAWFYFGSPVPQSVQAKLLVYHLNPADSFIRLIQHYATPFQLHQILPAGIAIAIGIILYPFLYIIGARHVWEIEKRLLVWVLYPWLYLAVFALSNPLIFRWYLTPPLPAYFFVLLFGLDHMASAIAARKPAAQKWLPALFLTLSVLVPLSAWTLRPDHGPSRPAPVMAYIELEELYHRAARLVRPELQPGDVIAAGDVGVLGYDTGAHILDTVGLNSPESLAYYPIPLEQYVINYAIPTALILEEAPDWIIVQEVYGRNTFLSNPAFNEIYTQFAVLPNEIYGSQGMVIYRHNFRPVLANPQ
jgi:4-amino-4-deoxy-L-arabinose transferase-like glycosyltransferase